MLLPWDLMLLLKSIRTLTGLRNRTKAYIFSLMKPMHLCKHNTTYMSEAQLSCLKALLFRTSDQSRDIVLVLATNRPGDLDNAVTDMINEVIEFPLPGEEERFKLLNFYLSKYLKKSDNDEDTKPRWSHLFKKLSQKITVEADTTDEVFSEAAKKTEGFSGREIAKLVARVQAGVYGRKDCVLDSQLFTEIFDYKVEEHHQRHRLASDSCQPLLFSYSFGFDYVYHSLTQK